MLIRLATELLPHRFNTSIPPIDTVTAMTKGIETDQEAFL